MNRTSLTNTIHPLLHRRGSVSAMWIINSLVSKYIYIYTYKEIKRERIVHREFGKLSGNPIVFAPSHPLSNTVSRSTGYNFLSSRPALIIGSNFHSPTTITHYLAQSLFLSISHPILAVRGKLMYRVYIIAGRQAKPARALASSAFGWVSNWTHLTRVVMRDQRGTGKKSTPSKTVNQPLPAETTEITRLPFSPLKYHSFTFRPYRNVARQLRLCRSAGKQE